MKPFHDVRVLDLTHVLAGPFCTYQLAVLGAEVIKIESPTDADMMRTAGPDNALADNDMGIHYLSQSAGKRAMTLNLKSEEGHAILKKLARSADVLVENYRGGVLAGLGLGYDDLQKCNPRLIYCSMTGFGQTGPKASHAAYDNVIQAYSGLMEATGTEQSGPIKIGPPVLDYGTGAQAAMAISAALYHRNETGTGQYIDVAMLDAALMLMSSAVVETIDSGEKTIRSGNSSAVLPGYGCFQTSDGLLVVGAYTRRQHAMLWQALGRRDEAEHSLVMSREEMTSSLQTSRQLLSELLLEQSAEYWEELLNAAGVPAARVRNLKEALASGQVKSRSIITQVPHPSSTSELLGVPVAAFGYEHDGPSANFASPRIGEHTNDILRAEGFSEQDIDGLRQRGVV